MEKFESIVLAVALIMLIICFIVTGVMITNYSKSGEYPSTAGTCPDYWKLLTVDEYDTAMNNTSGYSETPATGVTTCSASNKGTPCSGGTGYRAFCYDEHNLANNVQDYQSHGTIKYIEKKTPTTANAAYPYTIVEFSKKSEICDSIVGDNTIKGKKSWAVLNGITWDGVTNTNKCDLKKDTSGVTTLI